MAYAEIADVQELNTGRPTYGATTKPTASQVADFLEQTAAELDGIMRAKGYLLPVPSTAISALKWLEGANAAGGWYKVELGAQASDRREEAERLWRSMKRSLRDGEIDLELDVDPEQQVRFSAPEPIFSLDDVREQSADRASTGQFGEGTRDF